MLWVLGILKSTTLSQSSFARSPAPRRSITVFAPMFASTESFYRRLRSSAHVRVNLIEGLVSPEVAPKDVWTTKSVSACLRDRGPMEKPCFRLRQGCPNRGSAQPCFLEGAASKR